MDSIVLEKFVDASNLYSCSHNWSGSTGVTDGSWKPGVHSWVQVAGNQAIEVTTDGQSYFGNGSVTLRVESALDVQIVEPSRGMAAGGMTVKVFGVGFTEEMFCVFGLKE